MKLILSRMATDFHAWKWPNRENWKKMNETEANEDECLWKYVLMLKEQ